MAPEASLWKSGLLLLVAMLVAPTALGQEAVVSTDLPEPHGDTLPAEDDGGAEPTDDPEYETVVVATRLPEEEHNSTRAVSIINEAELLERAPRTTPEALLDAPGVFVQHTNHGGGSPIVRGMIGPQNLILLDGVRLNNSVWRTGPLQYLNLVDPLVLGRIEVLRGPGSVLYGSDAVGGVIQLQLIRPEQFHDHDSAYGGRFIGRVGTADVQLTAHGLFGLGGHGFSLLGGATYKSFSDLTAGREIGRQEHSGYSNWSALGRLRWQRRLGSGLRLTLSGTYLSSGITGAGRTDKLEDLGSLQIYDNIDHLLFVRGRLRIPAIATTIELTTSFQHFFERKDTLTLDEMRLLTLRTIRDEVTARTLGLDLDSVTRFLDGRLRLRLGGMWYHDWVEADRWAGAGEDLREVANGAYPDGSTYSSYGVYALLDGRLLSRGDHEFRLSVGYRLHGMAGFAPADGFEGSDSSHVGHVVFASAQYLLQDRLNLSFTFSQGFRAPNLNESALLGDTGKYFHVPNDNLRPEQSDTFELLGRLRLGPVSLEVTGYVSLIRDLIRRQETAYEGQTEIEGKPVAWNINAGDGLIWGIEPRLVLALGQGLSLAGHLTYTVGQSSLGDVDHVPMSRIPPLFGQLTLRYEHRLRGRMRFFVEALFRGAAKQDRLSPEDERDVRIPVGGTPGWWTLGARAGVVDPRHFALRVGLDNLLDTTYRYHGSGVHAPGVNALVTAALFF